MSREDLDEQRIADRNERNSSVRVRGLVVLHKTEKALLVIDKEILESAEQGGNVLPFKVWLPISQIHKASPELRSIDKGDEVELWVPKWLAVEKEFLYD